MDQELLIGKPGRYPAVLYCAVLWGGSEWMYKLD